VGALVDEVPRHDPAESTTNTSYDEVGRRVGQILLLVSVGDAGAVAIECPEGQTSLGPLGEERGQRLRRRW